MQLHWSGKVLSLIDCSYYYYYFRHVCLSCNKERAKGKVFNLSVIILKQVKDEMDEKKG